MVNNLKACHDVTHPNALSNILIIEFPFFKLQRKQRGLQLLHGGCLRTFARNSKVRNSR
jgi:hypothetical protein